MTLSSIAENLPVLQVVIPLLAAAFCALTKSGRIAWLISTIAVTCSFIIIVILYLTLFDVNNIRLGLGGHKPPYGIEYNIDSLNIIILLLVSFIGLLVILYARKSIQKEIKKSKQSMFYSMYLLCFAGLLGIASTNDIFNIYVFIEISSLATYTMISLGKDRKALTAAYSYLILGTIGATFFLIGVGFLYIVTGSLNITDIGLRLKDIDNMRPIQISFAFISLGLFMKIALFPVHIWLTNSYAYAPSAVSSFLSATATKVMIYVFIRCAYTVFGYELSFNDMLSSNIIIFLSVSGVLLCSLTAIYQTNVKRLLAFSSVAQIGYIMIGVGIATEAGLAVGIMHLSNHALSKCLLFLSMGCIFYQIGSARLNDIKGISKRMPYTSIFFMVGAFSLLGIPGTAGFITKWHLLNSLLEINNWLLFIIVIISSILAIIYIWKVVDSLFFGELDKKHKDIKEAPISMLIIMFILALANIYFGFNTEFTADLAKSASHDLFSGVVN